jgi:tetratricopeptide (TPR) repeat protein
MYHCGYGVHQDIRRCEEIFKYAANKDVKLLGCIAVLYHTHEGIQDFAKAFEWYSRLNQLLCENSFENDNDGFIMSCNLYGIGLGLLCEYGDVVEQDYGMAMKYYKELADSESSVGFYFLGLIFYYGKGVPADYEEALYNFKKALDADEVKYSFPFIYDHNDADRSESGSNRVYCVMDNDDMRGEASYHLALMYKNGLDVPQDEAQAQQYFRKARGYGCERAKYEPDKY